jgi:hypothetical protein
MIKRLTVAHYKEDLGWLNQINPQIEIFIYHKNDDTNLKHDQKIIINDKEFILPNVGRESHTYLKHIIDNYDNLADIEYFSQGLNDHASGFVDFVNNDNTPEYKHISDYHKTFMSKNGYITEHMKNEGYETRHIWDMLFDYDPPEEIEITVHGLFKIDKTRILKNEKLIYEKCLDLFSDNDKDNINAWNFEYFWPLLFHRQ